MKPKPCKPVTIDLYSWYYAEKKCLSVVHQIVEADGSVMRTDIINIPWTKIRKSLKEMDEAKG